MGHTSTVLQTALAPLDRNCYPLSVNPLVRAVAFIERNVEEELDGQRLAHVAGLSRFHFHRQFARAFGVGVRAYVEQVRLRRAAFRLAFRRERILDIALDSGFASHEAFGRAFKRTVGQTPSEFRRAPGWDEWSVRMQGLLEIRRTLKATLPRVEVRIVERPAIPVIGLHHDPQQGNLLASARRFIDWRRRNGLSPGNTPTFNLMHRDRAGLAFCVGTSRRVELEPDMFVGVVPGGRCAVVRHVGDEESLRRAAHWLTGDWLSATGHTARDGTLVFQRIAFFPDVAEREAIADVILPLG
jgi:AraC family transcriptional regulator